MANFCISPSTLGQKRASTLPIMANRRRSANGKSRDRISMLPDELLVSILSHLTVEEAIATSLLSRKWRCLWNLINMLDFDGMNLLLLLKNKLLDGDEGSEIDEERMKYIRWVNRVMALSKSPIIEKFRVFLDLRKRDSRWIDEWLRFALARKVQRLELNLTNDATLRIRYKDEELYTFPYHMLRLDSIDFKSLKTVTLNNVNVDGETLQFFLCTCPLLQDLSVSGSLDLLTLKVTRVFYSYVQMRKLEKLVVRVGLYIFSSLQPLTDLLLVSRRLQRFVVKLWRVGPMSSYKTRCGCTLDDGNDARRVAKMQLRKFVPPAIKLEIVDVIDH